MIFERASENDIPQLLELIETCYRGDIARKGWTCELDLVGGNRTSEQFLIEEITAPGGSYLKYTDEQGKIAGCVYIKLNTQERCAFVSCLCVHPTLQSQGIGKKLLKASEDIARQAQCLKLCMKVLTVRKKLIAWYEKLGFKDVGEVFPFPVGCGTPKIPLELGSWEKLLE